MKFAFWNIRELDIPIKKAEVKNLVTSRKIKLLVLIDTKTLQQDHDSVFVSMFPRWSLCTNYSCTDKGRIWVAWDPKFLTFMPINITDRAIHGKVCYGDPPTEFMVSFIYGEHSFVKRTLWNDLEAKSASFGGLPWIVSGVFNAIRDSSDRKGGIRKWIPAFNDLKYKECRFSWSNRVQGEDACFRKIDRVLCNSTWTQFFNASEAEFLSPGVFDHSPAVITVDRGEELRPLLNISIFGHLIQIF